MTDEELIAKVEQEESISYGINDSALSSERAAALDYYLGEPFGNEVDGRSQVVSFDVQDTVEAALPQLLKIFASGTEVVRFDPKGLEDEEAAAQETDYINHVVMEQNNGFSVFYTWFKDALISKNGYVKVYYEDYQDSEEESYQGLTEPQLMMLTQNPDVEILEQISYPDEIAQQQLDMHIQEMLNQGQDPSMMQHPPIPTLYDVKISVTKKQGRVCIDNVAPENIMVSVDTKGLCLQDSRFVQHREMMTKAELKEMGFKVPDDLGSADTDWSQQESNARDIYSEQYDRGSSEADDFLVKDTYIRIDGKKKRLVVVGNTILLNEECETVPFVAITPMLMPHRHVGRSYADLTMDIQLIKSAMIRGQLDNMYLSNNGRYAVSDRVNLEDMLTSRPGGIVRVQGEPGAAILPLMHTPFPPTSFTMVEYLDTMKEKRTGVTAYNQGLDADSLNKTATGVNAIMGASQARLELVARLFAETGVKELFLMVHRLIRQNYTKPDIIRLRNKWVDIDPREWTARKDMSINVGLGTGNKDLQLVHLRTILEAQKQALQFGLNVVQESNVYAALIKLTENAGFRNPEEFWTDPASVPPKPPKEDPKLAIEKMKLDADAQKFKAETQVKEKETETKTQLDIQKFQAQAEIDRRQAEQEMVREQQRSQNDLIIEREKLQMQAELEKYKADLKAQTDLQIAQIQAEMQAQQLQRQMVADEHKSMMDQKRHEEQMEAMTRPKTVVRDGSGKVSGVQ